jgi:MFS family permease
VELPEDVRGRVYGVLNTLVSVASFVPIIIAGPIADFIGTQVVILAVGIMVFVSGVLSVATRGPIVAPRAPSAEEREVPEP